MCLSNCWYHNYSLVSILNGCSTILLYKYWSPVKNLCHTPEPEDEFPSVSSITLLSFLRKDDVWNLRMDRIRALVWKQPLLPSPLLCLLYVVLFTCLFKPNRDFTRSRDPAPAPCRESGVWFRLPKRPALRGRMPGSTCLRNWVAFSASNSIWGRSNFKRALIVEWSLRLAGWAL